MPTGGGGGGGGAAATVLTFATTGEGTFLQTAPTLNTVLLTAGSIPTAVSFGHITVNVGTADAVNLYDLGVYNAAGTLIGNIGARSLPSTGVVTFAISQGTVTLPAGLYAFGLTGNAVTGKIYFGQGSGAAAIPNWAYAQSNTITSSGGALPATVTFPSASVAFVNVPWFALSP